jgi:hypothetical protein
VAGAEANHSSGLGCQMVRFSVSDVASSGVMIRELIMYLVSGVYNLFSEISGSRGSEYEDDSLLGYSTMQSR